MLIFSFQIFLLQNVYYLFQNQTKNMNNLILGRSPNRKNTRKEMADTPNIIQGRSPTVNEIDNQLSPQDNKIKDVASELIQKYSQMGMPPKTNKGLTKTQSASSFSAQVTPIRKSTQGISTKLKGTKSSYLYEGSNSTASLTNYQEKRTQYKTAQRTQGNRQSKQMVEKKEVKVSSNDARRTSIASGPQSLNSFKNPYLNLGRKKDKEQVKEEEKVQYASEPHVSVEVVRTSTAGLPPAAKRKINLKSFDIDDILVPNITNKIFQKTPRSPIRILKSGRGSRQSSLTGQRQNETPNYQKEDEQWSPKPESFLKQQEDIKPPQGIHNNLSNVNVKTTRTADLGFIGSDDDDIQRDQNAVLSPYHQQEVDPFTPLFQENQEEQMQFNASTTEFEAENNYRESIVGQQNAQEYNDYTDNNHQSYEQIHNRAEEYNQEIIEQYMNMQQKSVNLSSQKHSREPSQDVTDTSQTSIRKRKSARKTRSTRVRELDLVVAPKIIYAEKGVVTDHYQVEEELKDKIEVLKMDIQKKDEAVNEYEAILQQLTQNCESQAQQLTEVQVKNTELDRKLKDEIEKDQEKEEQIISLERKEIFYEEKIQELNKELDFQRKLSQIAQQQKQEAENQVKLNEDLISQKTLEDQKIKQIIQVDQTELLNKHRALEQQNLALESQNLLIGDQLKKVQQDHQSQMLIEHELRTKNEQIQNQMRQSEFLARQKDEEQQTMRRHLEAAQRDIKSLAWLESQQKVEMAQIAQKRMEGEDGLQQLKQQIVSYQIFMRQKEMDVESLVRENRTLQGTLQMIQNGILQGANDMNRFKERESQSERDRFNLKNQMELFSRESQRLQDENQRFKNLLENERMDRDQEINRFQEQIRNLNQIQQNQQAEILRKESTITQAQQMQIAQPPPIQIQPTTTISWASKPIVEEQKFSARAHTQEDEQSDLEETKHMSMQEKYKQQRKKQVNFQESIDMDAGGGNNPFDAFRNKRGLQRDEDEQQEDVYNKVTLNNQKYQRAQSTDKGNRIAFPSQNSNDLYSRQNSDRFGGTSARDRALSSDRDMWNKGKNQNSDEKETPTSAFQRKKSAAHHKMFDTSQTPWGTTTEFEPRGNNQQKKAFGQRNMSYQGGGSVPQFQNNQDDSMPAAGAKKYPPPKDQQDQKDYKRQNEQSSLPWLSQTQAVNSVTNFQSKSVAELQQELSSKMIQKEQIEQEFWRFGNQSRTKQQIEKKKETEANLDKSNQEIQALKTMLRDRGATLTQKVPLH